MVREDKSLYENLTDYYHREIEKNKNMIDRMMKEIDADRTKNHNEVIKEMIIRTRWLPDICAGLVHDYRNNIQNERNSFTKTCCMYLSSKSMKEQIQKNTQMIKNTHGKGLHPDYLKFTEDRKKTINDTNETLNTQNKKDNIQHKVNNQVFKMWDEGSKLELNKELHQSNTR